MTTRFFKHPRAIERFRNGPLAGHLDRFAELLFELGYSRVYARKKLWLLRGLDPWLDRHGLRAATLDESQLAAFAGDRARRARRLKPGSGSMLKKFLAHLRESGAVPASPPIRSRDAKSRLERAFAEYLVKERGVCGATVDNYLHEISRFLAHICIREPLSPSRIAAKTLNAFVLHRARQVGPRCAKLTVTALRSFCQLIAVDEVGYVPLADVGAEFLFQVISERAERAAIVAVPDPILLMSRVFRRRHRSQPAGNEESCYTTQVWSASNEN